MPTVVDVTLPSESFALGALLTEHPDMFIEIERLVPLGDRLLPFFWVSNGSPEHIEDALLSQSIVESVQLLTQVDDRYLFQVAWTPAVNGLVDAMLETDCVILEGTGVAGSWELRLRFSDRQHLRQFIERCTEKEIDVELQRIYNPHVPSVEDELTPAQWQTLAVAYKLDYFSVPRGATLAEIADELGVSNQAVSQRLRRATNTLVGMQMHRS
jgi:predicted DNA binding protein